MSPLNVNISSLITNDLPNSIFKSKNILFNFASETPIVGNFLVSAAENINNCKFVNDLATSSSKLQVATFQISAVFYNGFQTGTLATQKSPKALATLALGYFLANNPTDLAFFSAGVAVGVANSLNFENIFLNHEHNFKINWFIYRNTPRG